MIVKPILNKFIIIVVVFFLLAPIIFASSKVDIFADELEYNELVGTVIARGHVVLAWSNKKIFADHVEFLISKKNMIASGNVTIEENGNIMHSETLVYNYDGETGEIKETFVSSSNLLYVRSKSVDRLGKDTFSLKHATFSSCDLDEPHSYFKSNRGKLVLNKRITIYNAVFYIGKIPVFYLPFVTKSLKSSLGFGSHLRLTVEPGSTGTGGFYVRTSASCALSENSFARIKHSHFTKRGEGYGGEFNCITKCGMLNIDVYTIKDLLDKKKKLAFGANFFHKLNNIWTLRSGVEVMNDNSFYDFYNQNNWDRTTNHLKSYASLTRQGEKASTEINVEHISEYNATASKYKDKSINLPKVSWTCYQREFGWGITHKPLFEYGNIYKEYEPSTESFYKKTAIFGYNLTKSFRVGRKFVLTPGLNVSENWYDKNDKNEFKNAFFVRYGGTFNTRFIATSWMDWNIRYKVLAKTKATSLNTDTDSQNCGIENNNITFSNCMYIGDKTVINNSIKYNFKCDNENISNKLEPLVSDLTWIPVYCITVCAKKIQQLKPSFKLNSLQVDIKIGELTRFYFNFGLFYQHYNNHKEAYRNSKIDNFIGIGLWLNPKWRVDYNIRSAIVENIMYSRLNGHELKIYRDCHCYNLGIIYRKRTNDWDCGIRFDMKTNMPLTKNSNNSEYDDRLTEIFYPWQN